MDYKKLYQDYKQTENKAFELFKKCVKSENPEENLVFKLASSRIEKDHIFLNVFEQHVVSSLGSFEKFEVKVPFSDLENGETENIEYDRKVTSALGLI